MLTSTDQTSTETVVRRDCLIRIRQIKRNAEQALAYLESREPEKAKRLMTKIDELSFSAQLNLAYLSA